MALKDLTAEAVNKAIEEFDTLGRSKFLEKYDFGKARGYLLRRNEKTYDSKAIAGAAHGYLPGHTALVSDEFSGGAATVKKTLESLGFEMVAPEGASFAFPEEVLTNEEISQRFAVGNMGGMRRSTKNNLLVLISDPFKGLYEDRWEGDVLHYTGMGPTGEQSLTYAQNRTLAESPQTGISVHLLEALDPQKYTYLGEVQLIAAPYQEEQVDDEAKPRKVWMFPLRVKEGGIVPKLTDEQAQVIEESHARVARKLSDEELKARAQRAKKMPAVRTTHASSYIRDESVAEYAKRSAKGVCNLCEKPAPFLNKQKEPYLECHHVIWLALGGDDAIENTVALCPNCHRKMHVVNSTADQEKLKKWASSRS